MQPHQKKSITMALKIQDVSKADDPSDLQSALDDLSEVIEEAEEKGYQIPSETAISEAKRLLRTMYEVAPQRFEVYPMPEGAVTIDATNENGHYLMVLVANDGSVRCLTNSASDRSRQHFNSTPVIPAHAGIQRCGDHPILKTIPFS